MPSELSIHAEHQGGMCFNATNGSHTIVCDYPLEPGDAGLGLRSLELLLASLATCVGNTMGVVLTRMRKPFASISVDARGQRRDEHPTVITGIDVEVTVVSDELDEATAQRALRIADDELCPVWAMLKPGTPIAATVRVAKA